MFNFKKSFKRTTFLIDCMFYYYLGPICAFSLKVGDISHCFCKNSQRIISELVFLLAILTIKPSVAMNK